MIFIVAVAQTPGIDQNLIIRRILGQRREKIMRAMSMVTQIHVDCVHQELNRHVHLIHIWSELEAGDEFRAGRTDRAVQVGMIEEHAIQPAAGDPWSITEIEAGNAIRIASLETADVD